MDRNPLRAVDRALVVLGATGSIGGQTLEVAEQLGMPVVGLAARSASPALLAAAHRFPDARVVVVRASGSGFADLQREIGGRLRTGDDSLIELAGWDGAVVLNGIVGSAGLPASVAALEAGNRLALANKESLVAGGPVVEAARRSGGGELIPVDSEHSALLQCLLGEEPGSVRRLTLTASGGPFLGWDRERLQAVTAAQALAHPTWRMGRRISVDSATLMNKAFEVIEAHYLFGIPYEHIQVVIHPQSLVHSLVEFVDGSLKAQISEPDMRLPIQYALTYPSRLESVRPPFELAGHRLDFIIPDQATFPALALGRSAASVGGSSPAVLNAADEVAVEAFLAGRIGFMAITQVVELTLERVLHRELASVADVLAVDREARDVALELVAAC